MEDYRVGCRWGSLLLCLMLPGSPAQADDWPQWRGPTRDGVWRESGLVESFAGPTIAIRWRASISSGYSGPTVAGQSVYVSDRVVDGADQFERVHCFDALSGRKIWSHSYACPYGSVAKQAGPRGCVTVHDGQAYSLGTMGHLYCFDATSGAVRWQKDLAAIYHIRMPTWGIACSPLVEQDLLIVQIGGADGACLVALETATGALRGAR